MFGKSQQEHDEALRAVLDRLQTKGFTLNRDKCQVNKDEVEFFGIVFTKDGVRPDRKKVIAVEEMAPPQTKAEARSLLGMVGFNERFIPRYAEMTAPIRELTKKDQPWSWGPEHQISFEYLKRSLTSDTVLRSYEVGLDTHLVVDAGPHGLGAALLQKGPQDTTFRPVMFSSRTLKDPETRYSQTEKEALAVRWGVKKHRQFLLGAKATFTVITDHRPLVTMFKKSQGDLPPRIERFVMDLQEYDYNLVYAPGVTNMSDYLSRHPRATTGTTRTAATEEHVRVVVTSALPPAITLDVVKTHTLQDRTLTKLKSLILSGTRPRRNEVDLDLRPFTTDDMYPQLCVVDDVICRGNRVVMPASLQKDVVRLSHQGHQGISKTKAFLRTFCWYPGIDQQVEQTVKECVPCQAATPQYGVPPVQASDLPNGPWLEVQMDFLGLFPSGDYLLVMIDLYSRWLEVYFFRTAPTLKTTIGAMRAIFADKGIPVLVQSDNGPPYQSTGMTEFAAEMGFRYHHITPEWPRTNGSVERINRTLVNAIRSGGFPGDVPSDSPHYHRQKPICRDVWRT